MNLIHLREGFWAVQVPEDAKNFRFGKSERLKSKIFFNTTLDYWAGSQVVELPPSTWSIVCTSKEATEEQADRIVEHIEFSIDYYKDYESGGMVRGAENSFISLLTSKGLDLKNSFLILKKH